MSDNMEKIKRTRNRQKQRKQNGSKRSGLWWIPRMENTGKISLVSEEAQPNKSKNINSIKNTKNINNIKNISNMLPPEILERIFQFLVSQDLSNVLLVCRRWRNVGEAPWFWSGYNLTAEAGNLHIMPKLLTINRMKALKKLEMREVTEELLQAILESSGIYELNFDDVDLSKIKSELITRICAKMEYMAFYNTKLSSQQVKSIFTALCGNSKLKKLKLYWNNLSSVEPTQLAKAVIKLEELDLGDTKLTNQQTKAIFAAIGDGTKLKKLHLNWNNLSSVEPAHIAKAVIKLEELDLFSTELTSQQAKAIFTAIGDGSKLKKLDLSCNNLSSVEPVQLAKAVIKLEELHLRCTKLTSQQTKAIFTAIGDGSKLKKLIISFNNLSSVEPTQLSTTVIKLEELDLSYNTKLTSQQTKAIFDAIGDGSKLKKLIISHNNLSTVEPAQLAKAVIKLEKLDLRDTKLTSHQAKAISGRCNRQ